jgi:hypothetical protein
MEEVINLDAARKRKRKGVFEMAREAVKIRIGKDKALQIRTKLVGVRLADFFNRRRYVATGELDAWPSMETLIELTGMSWSSVRRSLRDLEKAGHLVTICFGSNYAKRTSRYRAIADAQADHLSPLRTEQAS